MTLTGFAADLRPRNGQVLLRRLLAVAAMLAGATAWAVLVLHQSAAWALALAVALPALACACAWVLGRRPGTWQAPAHWEPCRAQVVRPHDGYAGWGTADDWDPQLAR